MEVNDEWVVQGHKYISFVLDDEGFVLGEQRFFVYDLKSHKRPVYLRQVNLGETARPNTL